MRCVSPDFANAALRILYVDYFMHMYVPVKMNVAIHIIVCGPAIVLGYTRICAHTYSMYVRSY